MPIGAVVTGASYRALAVVRSLGRERIPVRLVRTDEHALATASRYARRRLSWPADEADRVEFLVDLATRHGLQGWVLIPTHDDEAVTIARHREALAARYRLTTPPWRELREMYDKRCLHTLADRLGISQPWTFFPAQHGDAASALEHAEGRFPVVVKPACKAAPNRLTVDKAWRADDLPTLRKRFEEACTLVEPDIVMVQELVPGDGGCQLSFAALCAEGEVLAALTARRLRQYPIDFGRASSYVETADEPGLEPDARRLIAATRFTGMVEIEFKRDCRSGAQQLLDANPRAWGWQSLGARAGVDFPYLLWRLATGRPVPETESVPGVRWVRMATDLLAAGQQIRSGGLPLRDYVRSLRGPLEFAVFAADDPLPALVGPFLVARLVAGRVAAGRPL